LFRFIHRIKIVTSATGFKGAPAHEGWKIGYHWAMNGTIQRVLILFLAAGCTGAVLAQEAQEGNADVEYVRAIHTAAGTWTFHVTVRHPDTGWDDYADGWDVLRSDGTVVRRSGSNDPFTRLLLHPHVTEQPFTRSQGGLVLPDDETVVTVRAHDLRNGWGGAEVVVDLSRERGDRFEVVR